MKILHDGPHSLIEVQEEEGGEPYGVKKTPRAFLEHNVLPREWVTLGGLAWKDNWLHIPRAFFLLPDSFWMSYCGEPLTPANLPDDWDPQGEEILRLLEESNYSHNDIRPENLLVKDGRLYLIDFAWATKIGDPIPPEWPKALGGKYKKGEHDFDDAYSLWKSLEEISGSS